MQDVEFVKQLLATKYRTHLPSEYPYPDLRQLIADTDFDFMSGEVLDQRENGEPNRDGIFYQFFPAENKRILVHRFIVAVALGKWPPRDLDVHHLNSRPDDNRPTNLELVTRRDNNAARRAPLREVADLEKANKWVNSIPKVEKQAKRKNINGGNAVLGQTGSALDYARSRKVDTQAVLDQYYQVPEGVTWTGKRKGNGGCYREATNGIWYYVNPETES